MAGRPSEYNSERHEVIVRAVAAGDTIDMACAAAGVSKGSYYRWKRVHLEFASALRKADAERQRVILSRLRTAGKDEWKSHAWELERSSEDWRERKSVSVDVQKGVQETIEALHPMLSESAWAEVCEALVKLADGGEGEE